MADSRRFPPSAYEEDSLLWKDSEWRQPLPAERAQMMGVPPDSLQVVEGEPALRRQRQNSLLGNGFHIYSIMALFCLLPQLLEAKLVKPLVDVNEVNLQQRLLHTVWEPGRLDHFPGLATVAELVAQLPAAFPDCVLAPQVWTNVAHRLGHCDVRPLQTFIAWSRLRGMPVDELGPHPLGRRERARIYSGLSGQRYPADSSRGLDHLLPPSLGKLGHIQASAQLPSPFQASDWPEPDVLFVIEAICVWRQFLPSHCEAAAYPADCGPGPPASGNCPCSLACGECSPCGLYQEAWVHRPYDSAAAVARCAPSPADQVVDKLVNSRPPKHSQDIFEQTQAEQDKGFCSPLYTRGYNKRRMIDNAKRTEHNQHTIMSETIFTVNIDFVASVASSLVRRLQHAPHLDSWLRLRLGTDDLPDAYRGLPVHPDHQRFSVVALYVPQVGWRFTVLWGLAFGLESAVVSFNRFALLGISIARRCTLAMTAQYFDDELAVEAIADSDVSQAGLRLTFELMGASPQPDKGFTPGANRHYLGSSLHVGEAVHAGFVRVQPKYATMAKVVAKLDDILQRDEMSRDEAGKLRGDINWMFSMCLGHLGKIAGPALAAHQHGESPELQPHERHQLLALRQAVLTSRPRDIPLHSNDADVVRIYTDASFEDDVLRLGWVIFAPHTLPLGGTTVVPQEVIAGWTARSQQIYPGETLAAVVVPALHAADLMDHDCLWFIDNEAAASALVRATTAEIDVLALVQQAHLQFHELNMRVWFEWIDTETNPSDGLSRDGLRDPWTQRKPSVLANAFSGTFGSVLAEAVLFPVDTIKLKVQTANAMDRRGSGVQSVECEDRKVLSGESNV
eukprot:s1483_g11.t1